MVDVVGYSVSGVSVLLRAHPEFPLCSCKVKPLQPGACRHQEDVETPPTSIFCFCLAQMRVAQPLRPLLLSPAPMCSGVAYSFHC